MPSESTASGYTFRNLGPLTTAWTAPASCAAAAAASPWGGGVKLALTALPMYPYLGETCTGVGELGGCFPSGAALDELYSSGAAESATRPLFALPVFSPGVACPDAWTTAGVAVRDEAGALASSGIFAPTRPAEETAVAATTSSESYGGYVSGGSGDDDEDEGYTPGFNPLPNILMQALDRGETAVVCCPSDFTADPGGGCYSQLPRSAYTATTGCQRAGAGDAATIVQGVTFSWGGTLVTDGLSLSYTGTGTQPYWSPVTTTLDARDDGEGRYAGLVTTPMVTLLRRAGEGEGQGEGGGAGAGEDEGGSGVPASAGRDAGMLVAVWVVAALVGAVLVFPS